MAHYDIFREQLASRYPAYGHALWEPDLGELYCPVEVGDVGYIREGRFRRLFNALLSDDHPSHQIFGVPEDHEPLVPNSSRHIDSGTLKPNHYCSTGTIMVPTEPDARALGPEDFPQVSFLCSRRRGGAVLSLPVEAHREDTVARGDFGRWMVKHINRWFAFARQLGLGIEQMEEIVLVTGCHRTRSWTNVAFLENQADVQISFGVKVDDGPDPSLKWHPPDRIRGAVLHWGPDGNLTDLREDKCIFIRGFRVARAFGLLPRGAAGPNPDLDGHDGDLIPIPTVTKYRDPLYLLLEYVAGRAPDCDMALVHDDDLARIDGICDSYGTLQPDAVMGHLKRSKLEVQHVLCDTNGNSQRTGGDAVTVAMFSKEFQEWNLPPPRQPTVIASQVKIPHYTSELPVAALRTPPDSPPTKGVMSIPQGRLFHTSSRTLSSNTNSPSTVVEKQPHRSFQSRPHSSFRNPVAESQDHPTPPPPPPPSPSPSPPSSRSSSSLSTYSGTATATPSVSQLSSYTVGPPSEPLPPAPPSSQISGQRLNFHPFAVRKSSKGARQATTPITKFAAQPATGHTRPQTSEEAVRRAAEQREIEEAASRVSAQPRTMVDVRSLMECLLSGRLSPDEDRSSVLSACAQTCEIGGLDLSTVLQEMVIEGYPPIYWAILNRGAASGSSDVALDSLVFTLLDACRPLSPATLHVIRVACMTASDNVLLQRLFREIPPLSPISARDAVLLGPTSQGDHVDVEEKRDATGSFVAHIQIPRFRLRMRVCESVAVEFVASWRIWILRFNTVVETAPDGQPRSKWYLSLELGEHSLPITVNASLFITESVNPADNRDPDPTRTISFGCNTSELSPGRVIKVLLNDGPMDPHLLYESPMLVDSNETFHAQLSQSALGVLTPRDTDEVSTTNWGSVEVSLIVPPPVHPPPEKQQRPATLRRGGH